MVQKLRILSHCALKSDEFIQFAKFARKHVRARDEKTGTSVELQMYIAASDPGICETFPNVNVAFRIYLRTNCSGERSSSVLSRVKNEIRTTMSDERLNALSLMAIESNLVRSLDFESVTDRFASSKASKAKL